MRPTRLGRDAPLRSGRVFVGVGSPPPDVVTEDPEPPTDRTDEDGVVAYVPFADPPAAGPVEDFNLTVGTDSDGGGDRTMNNPTRANDGDISTKSERSSYFNPGGTKTTWLKADLGSAQEIEEIVVRGGFGNAAENDPPFEIQHSPDGSTWTTAVGSYVWDDTTSPNTATLTLTSPQTKRYWRVGQTTSYSGLIYPIQIFTWQLNGPSVGSPTNALWVEAPLTIDGDNATYDSADDDAIALTEGAFWRISLTDAYLIASIEAKIGFEDAGAVDVLVQAGNESDYSDAVTITTISVTATGSFTSDDVEASWAPTAVYQYWRLVMDPDDQGVRVFEVRLLDPPEPSGVHGDLTGRSEADQHPADAVTFDPYGSIGSTDVQGALEELIDEVAGGGGFALPTVVAVGTSASGTGDVTPGLPTGHTTNDILLLFVQSDNQAATAPAGYQQLGPCAGIGTAAAAGATRLTTFWKRDGGSEAAPTVTDTGDHTLAQMMAIRGCPTVGDPFLNVGAVRKATASTTGTAYPGATPIDACLVVDAFVHALDSASAVFSSPTNADLANVTEQIDVATADGNGGGFGVITGEKAKAGNFAATTVTMTSGINMAATFVMLPAGITSRAGFIDRQMFLTPGTDTWVKPTAGKHFLLQGIGGGASGSAGRNAATASGGGGGGGGSYMEMGLLSHEVTSTSVTVTVGSGGAATANSDGAASSAGTASVFASSPSTLFTVAAGLAAGAAASGSGGAGGAGGGYGAPIGIGVSSGMSGSIQSAGGGTGGTTAGAGGFALGPQSSSGGGGAGGGTTQASSAGGSAYRSGAGGGGGRSNTNVGTGGAGRQFGGFSGGATAGANGTDSTDPLVGGGGGAGGTSASGPGGTGGWPGGGGGGGGSQSGAQRGGAGGDGTLVVTTFC